MKKLGMKVKALSWLCAAASLMGTAGLQAGPCKNVLVYYTSWSKYNSPAYNFTNLPYSKITHICYAFITPNADGSLNVPTDYMGADGVHYDGVSMVAAAHAAGVKVLLSCGGSGAGVAGNFTTIAASSGTINNFAANLLAYCQANHFDGVDIDWEFPNTSTTSTEFDNLLAGIRAQMPAPTWLLTAALSADSYEPTFLHISTINNYLSYFNLMCYDYHGSWLTHSGDNASLFEDSADPGFSHTASGVTAVNYYVSNGASASKINYGLPFYGYGFNTSGLYQSCGGNCNTTTLTYAQIAPLVGAGWTRNFDSSSESPNLVYGGGASVISYDDSQSVSIKAQYVLNSMGVAGVFAWSADQDYNGSTQPLLDAMYSVASAGCGPTNTPTKTGTPTFTPTAVVQSTWRVNAGGPLYTDTSSNVWVADTNYSGGTGAAGGGAISGTTDPTLFDTQRYGASFSYSFNVPAGSYQVTLRFAETYSGDFVVGARVFNVAINGTTVLPNLDVYAQVGGNAADDKVLNNISASGGVITIQFTGTASTDPNALVEAIQIVPMPITPTFTKTNTPVPPTATFTFTKTNTPTNSFTNTPVPPTSTFTFTKTNTPANSYTPVPPTNTFTSTNTLSPTGTNTATRTNTPTNSFTNTPVPPTNSFTPTKTNTPTNTRTGTPTNSFTGTVPPTSTFTNTSTRTWTGTSTFTPANTASFTPTKTNTPTDSTTPTMSPTGTSTATLTATASPTFTSTFTPVPPSATPTNSPTATFTFTNSSTPTNSFTGTAPPTATFSSTPTRTFTGTSTFTFTNTPTSTPTRTFSSTSTFTVTNTGTFTRTFTPSFTTTPTQTSTFTSTSTPSRGSTPIVYPNPISGPGPAHLWVPLTAISTVKVQVFTTAFREVASYEVPNVAPGTAVDIPLENRWGTPLANGLYYLLIEAQGKRWTVKLMVLR